MHGSSAKIISTVSISNISIISGLHAKTAEHVSRSIDMICLKQNDRLPSDVFQPTLLNVATFYNFFEIFLPIFEYGRKIIHSTRTFFSFRFHILYGKENYSMKSGAFRFSNAFCQFNENLFMSQICVMPSAFVEFETLYLREYWLERCRFLKICMARLQLTMSQIFSVLIFFAEKLLAKINRKRRKFFKDKSSNLTCISTIRIRWVHILVELARNQLF